MADDEFQQQSSQRNDQPQCLPDPRSIQLLPGLSNPNLLRRISSENVVSAQRQPQPQEAQDEQEEQEEEKTEEELNVCAGLLEDDTFHGMVPMEDLNQLLKQNGNFLIRSDDANQDGRKIIVSVFWNGQVKHQDVRGATQGVTLDSMNIKPTVNELIAFHLNEKIPISAEGVLLGKAIKRQSWELRRDCITQTVKLGEGAFGEVYRGTLKDKMTGQIIDVAIKVPKTKDISKDLVGEAMKEARIQKDYVHPNVVRLYGVSAETDPLMIVLEYIDGGSLEDYLKKYGPSLNPDHKAMLCYDVSRGLSYLHSRHCIHRDIAARNCLFCITYGVVKISDFGLSSVGTMQVMDVNKPAPIRWLAPEVLKTANYLKSSDIWALGIVYWEINTLCYEVPFKNYSILEVRTRLTSMTEFHPELPPTTVPEVRDLALKCWNMDYTKRPTAEQCTIGLKKYEAPSRYARMNAASGLEIAQRGGQINNRKKVSKQQRQVPSKMMGANPAFVNNRKIPSKMMGVNSALLNNKPGMSRDYLPGVPKKRSQKSASKSTSSSKGGTREALKKRSDSTGSKKVKKCSNEKPRFPQQPKKPKKSKKSKRK